MILYHPAEVLEKLKIEVKWALIFLAAIFVTVLGQSKQHIAKMGAIIDFQGPRMEQDCN